VVSAGGFQLTIPTAAIASGTNLTATATDKPNHEPRNTAAQRTTTALLLTGDITCNQTSTVTLTLPDQQAGTVVVATNQDNIARCLAILSNTSARGNNKQPITFQGTLLDLALGPLVVAVYSFLPQANTAELRVVTGDASHPKHGDWFYLDVHGIQTDAASVEPLAQWQGDHSDAQATLVFQYDFTQSPQTTANQLAAFLHRPETPIANQPVTLALIGHSYGGEVLRYLAEHSATLLGNEVTCAELATLGTPHLGTPMTELDLTALGLNLIGDRGMLWTSTSSALPYLEAGTPALQNFTKTLGSVRTMMLASDRYPRATTDNPLDYSLNQFGNFLYDKQPNDGVVAQSSAQPLIASNGLTAPAVYSTVSNRNHIDFPDPATVGPLLQQFLPWPFGKPVRRITTFPDGNTTNWRSGVTEAALRPQSLSATGRYAVFATYDPDGNDYSFLQGAPGWNIVRVDLQTNHFELVSVSIDGQPANDSSWWPAVSADGRYVAFASRSSNLVANDTNNAGDVFVRDMTLQTTTRVSVNATGVQGNKDSSLSGYTNTEGVGISADGRWIIYSSWATNLVPNDTNNHSDIFVWDRLTNTTERVTRTFDGNETDRDSYWPSISNDGNIVVYHTDAQNVFSDIPDGRFFSEPNCIIYDRTTQVPELLCLTPTGDFPDNEADFPVISGNNRYIAYFGMGSNIVSNDTNNAPDIFRYDRVTKLTERVSLAPNGSQWPTYSDALPSISYDGRFVAMSLLTKFDPPSWADVYVWDEQAHATQVVSINSHGDPSNSLSHYGAISGDGHTVVFVSPASNLATGTYPSGTETSNLYVVGNPWVH